jgi:hypothetical protein
MMMQTPTMDMPGSRRVPTLRQVLALDAATGVAMGVLLVAAAAPLAGLLGLPPALLYWAGIVLFPCAALMLLAAASRPPPPALVWLIILGNAAWVIASIGVLVMLQPNALGITFVLLQAAVVAVMTVLEKRAL